MAKRRKPMTDPAIRYQLEKCDSGGAVSEVFEDRMQFLAEEWSKLFGEPFVYDEERGGVVLPDGRLAGLTFEAFITPATDDAAPKE